MYDQDLQSFSTEEERQKLVRLVSAFSFLVGLYWLTLHIMYENFYPLLGTAFLLLLTGAAFILSFLGKRIIASHAYMLGMTIATTLVTVGVYHSLNIKAVFPVLIGFSFLLFYRNGEVRHGIFHAILIVLSWIAVIGHEVNSQNHPTFGKYVLGGHLGDVVLLLCFVLIGFQILYFRRLLTNYGSKLQNANKAAKVANEAKSNFLASMSHELRTPMNGVIGLTEILSRSKLDDEQRDMVETIKASSFSLLQIVDDILDTSRVEAGKMVLHEAPVELRAFVRSIVESLRTLAEDRGIDLQLEIDPDVSEAITVDAVRLRQVLVNVIGNALKYSQKTDGRFGETVKVSVRVEGENLVFAVQDQGVGMTPAMLEELFAPFTRFIEKSNTQIAGAGLGMSISKRLVELMDGDIEVESERGVGSLFRIVIPHKPAMVQQEGAADLDWVSILKAHVAGLGPVLVVEDNAVNRQVIGMQLDQLGLQHDAAEDGYEGVGKWREGKFALILSDVQMPRLDGLEMTAEIRDQEKRLKGSPTPIIAITANAMRGEADKCLDAGMDDYLAKPVKLDELARQLVKWMLPEAVR